MESQAGRYVLLAGAIALLAGLGILAARSWSPRAIAEPIGPNGQSDADPVLDPAPTSRTPAEEGLAATPAESPGLTEVEAAMAPWEVDDDLKSLGEETDPIRIRRRILTHYLHEFRRYRLLAGERANPIALEPKQLQLTSIATILDFAGRSYEQEGRVWIDDLMARSGADHCFTLNERYYAFKRGEFPEYDQVIDFQLEVMAAAEKSRTIANYEGGLDGLYYDALEYRAVEALAQIYAK